MAGQPTEAARKQLEMQAKRTGVARKQSEMQASTTRTATHFVSTHTRGELIDRAVVIVARLFFPLQRAQAEVARKHAADLEAAKQRKHAVGDEHLVANPLGLTRGARHGPHPRWATGQWTPWRGLGVH